MGNLDKFLDLIKAAKFDTYMLGSSDEYLDEFVPPHLRRLEWLTGFTGSNGLAVISKDIKAFFTDGRYLVQAKNELDSSFTIYDMSQVSLYKWLAKNLANDTKLAYDSRCFSAEQIRKIKKFVGQYDIKLYRTNENPIDSIWKRKYPIAEKVELLPLDLTGNSTKEKIKSIPFLDELTGKQGYLTCDTATICWLLNLRAKDTENTPILHSYFLYNKRQSFLFADLNKFSDEIKYELSELKITVLDTKEILQFSNICKDNKIKIINLDANYVSYYFYGELKKNEVDIVKIIDPVIAAKAIKCPTEIEGVTKAHILDGSAKTKFLYWLSDKTSNDNLDELAVADKLLQYRKNNKEFLFPSFNTISAFAENGAITHYNATKKSNKKLDKDSLLLVDSGGQYKFGTTDITRTVAIGSDIKTEQKHNFTLVLKGHIALATSIFPKKTTGSQLDCLARQYLWQELKDYNHGTGHGVGSFLNVHEGPQSISKASTASPLKQGMVVTNEPGIYIEDNYGIRIENVLLVVKESENFLRFETLSLAPIDERLINFTLLDAKEKSWLKNYHQKIATRLAEHLSEQEQKWIENKIALYS